MEIPHALFLRLEEPVALMNTSATLMERPLSRYEAHTGQAGEIAGQSKSSKGRQAQAQFELAPRTSPGLRHTRIGTAETSRAEGQ
jgi:hypothetical protein